MVAIVRLLDRLERVVTEFPEGPPEGEGWWGDTSTMEYLSLAPASIVRGYADFVSARSEALQAFG
jgi:hypothetical protein